MNPKCVGAAVLDGEWERVRHQLLGSKSRVRLAGSGESLQFKAVLSVGCGQIQGAESTELAPPDTSSLIGLSPGMPGGTTPTVSSRWLSFTLETKEICSNIALKLSPFKVNTYYFRLC